MRHHPDWLISFLEYTADTEPPVAFRFWSGVSTIASTLRRKVWIDQKFFKWIPNFYIIFVAPPGIATKSTALDMGRPFLNRISGVKFGPAVMTWQSIPLILSEGLEMVDWQGNNQATSTVSFAVSEFGTLIDPTDRILIDCLVDIWDGKDRTWEKYTKGDGWEKVFNPWINLIAGTTPSWLQENYPKQMIGGGFTSRCIWVYSDSKDRLIAYPASMMDDNKGILKDSLIHDLQEINKIVGPYTLSKEAEAWGIEWYAEHYRNPPTSSVGEDQLHGYLARKQSHIHKLAIVISAAKTSIREISLSSLQASEKFITALEPDMDKIFSTMQSVRGHEATEQLVTLVNNRGSILERNLYRILFSRFATLRDFNNALVSAHQAGFLKVVTEDNQRYVVSMKEKKK